MPNKFYLNFKEDTGLVWKLTNELDTSTPYMEIDKETMLEFADERKKLSDYMVVPSTSDKSRYELKFKHYSVESFDVDKSIHKFPKGPLRESLVFNIVQDVKNGQWFVSLTDDLKKLLGSTAYYKDKNHLIFVTDQDDPNILLDTLRVEFKKAIETDRVLIENTDKEVAKRSDVSVYCGKVLDFYSHIVES